MLPEDIGVTPDLQPLDVNVRLLISVAIIAGGIVARVVALRLIRGDGVLSDTRRWWMVTVRNVLSTLVALGLFILWAPEIEEFALSITAFVVALVIATKELILCLSGATWRRTSRAFEIGDWVEIGGHSGDVIDETLFVTHLQEIEKREYRYTGRTIAVPNSLLLTQPVINHNFRKRFLEHEFTLHTPADAPALAIREAVMAALSAEFAGFETVARRYAAVIEKRAGVRLPDVTPTVRIETNIYGIIGLRCALFCPRDRAAEIEQVAASAMLTARDRRPGRGELGTGELEETGKAAAR
jgi:small-conductance mechanosensitive channel